MELIANINHMIKNPREHVIAFIILLMAVLSRRLVLILLAVVVAPFVDGWIGAVRQTPHAAVGVMGAPVLPRGAEPFESAAPPTTPSSAADRRMPSTENPFMNYQLDEITNNSQANKPDAFAANNATLRPEMEAQYGKLASAHIDDEADIWGRKYSSWAFYTIPGNSPVRDPDGTFQNWLYGNSFPTCREDVRFCTVKPPRTETPNENAIQDRTVAFGIGLDANTNRRVAAGAARGIASGFALERGARSPEPHANK